jgi:tetratricopeptide (TPR) repeat protein
MNRRERRAAGQNIQTDSGGAAKTPAECCEMGLRHLQSGEVLEAQLCCQQALSLNSDFADALHLMGLLSLHAEQAYLAIEWLVRAIRQEPKPQFLVDLGHALRKQGRLEEASKTFDKAVELDAASAQAWKGLAHVLADLKRWNEAILAFQHVLKLDPQNADAAYQSGTLLLQSGRGEEALALLDRSDQLQPDHAPTLQMRALANHHLGRLDIALADIGRAYALTPDDADICNIMGVVLRRLGREQEALVFFDEALEHQPDFTPAHSNKAYALGRLRRFEEALAIYAALKERNPENAEPEWNAALLHLITGNFEAGWAGREARWSVPGLPLARYDFPQPMWLGEVPINGKTILIYQDEGLGDAIQFARYVPRVAALGARVLLFVDDSLVPLLSKLAEVAECIPRSVDRSVTFDTHCAISSLPLAFGTRLETILSSVPYLPAPEAARVRAWEERLGPHDKLRVGLVWSGNPTHKDDHNRSLALRALFPLFDLDASFISLQKDARPDDRATLRERPDIVDLTAHLTDFVETAALVSCLDLVITVDTSMAHLAGALACPTWIMLPHTPDWRWLLDRDDSPWYPTVRLFRQAEAGNYSDAILRMRTALSARIAEFAGKRDKPADLRDADAAYQAGFLLFKAAKPEEALAFFDRADRLRPGHARTHQMRALALQDLKHLEEALIDMRRAQELDPSMPISATTWA